MNDKNDRNDSNDLMSQKRPATDAGSQDPFDTFLKKNLSPVPTALPHHEQKMLGLINCEPTPSSRRRIFSANNPWTGGLLAAAAALSLYVWTCGTQRNLVTQAPQHDLAAVEILVGAFDEVDEMTSAIPQPYLSADISD